jgi:proline racemase
MHLDALRSWQPPADWPRVLTLDAHTGGEPLRIVIAGLPAIEGDDLLARRRDMRDRLDRYRRLLMFEPRGHREMYGCILVPPVTPGAHFGVLFMHNEGYSSMCGHGIIAIARVAVDTGLVSRAPGATEVRIDTPAGLVTAWVSAPPDRRVAFRNVPSFVVGLDERVDVPGFGSIAYDLAFGGAFYAYVDARQLGLACVPAEYARLVEAGTAIKKAVIASRRVEHPVDADLSFVYGTIFVAPPRTAGAHSRNVCIFADGEVDRSPTGTGVCGRLAIHRARGDIAIGEPIVIESLVDTRFTCTVVEETMFAGHAAIVPEVCGEAFITGRHEFVLDPTDTLGEGFLV